MPTHAELAAKLLEDAAMFFRTVGEQNAPWRAQREENADVFSQVGALLRRDPNGSIDDPPVRTPRSRGERWHRRQGRQCDQEHAGRARHRRRDHLSVDDLRRALLLRTTLHRLAAAATSLRRALCCCRLGSDAPSPRQRRHLCRAGRRRLGQQRRPDALAALPLRAERGRLSRDGRLKWHP